MSRQPILIILVIALLTSISTYARELSKISDILVSADQMIRDSENNRISMVGDVQITFQGQYLIAQRVTVDLNKKTFIASGDVSFITADMTSEGQRVEMNYETQRGFIYDGFVLSGAVTFRGDIIEKVGDSEYIIKNGYYTACATCPPSWSFSGVRIRAELGGYAYIRHPILRLADYPVFWLPYLIIPLKSDRQTGLLFPTVTFSQSNGTALGQSFFWAIDEHKDATFTLRNYSNRGLKGLFNYRFYAGPKSYGELDLTYLDDVFFPSNARLTGFSTPPDSLERWLFRYKQFFNLPGNFVQKTQINLVSDIQYLLDFPNEYRGVLGDPALENRFSLTKNTEKNHFSLDAAYYVNLLKTNVKDKNDDAVHRFPELRYSLTETELGDSGLLFQVDAKFNNFSRNGNFSFDEITFDPNDADGITKRFDSSRDGSFDFGDTDRDQIRTGQRLDVQPKISYPMNVAGVIDLLPSLSYRQTNYEFGVSDRPSVQRSYAQASLSTRTELHRVFSTSPLEKFKHSFIPEIKYTNIPYFQQPDHPFFGSSSEEANFRSDQPITDEDFFSDASLQFDYEDRVLDRHLVTFQIENIITSKVETEDEIDYRQIGRFSLSQRYDIREAGRDDRTVRPWSDIEGRLQFSSRYFSTNSVFNYFPYHKVTNSISNIRLNNRYGDFLGASYTKNFIITDDINVNRDNRNENLGFQVGLVSRYFNLTGVLDYSVVTSDINSWNYQVQFIPPGACWGLVFRHQQVIGGESNFDFSFSFSFDGKRSVGLTDNLY